jgi:hypothetical protein
MDSQELITPTEPPSRLRERLEEDLATGRHVLDLLTHMPHEQSAVRGHFTDRCKTCLAQAALADMERDSGALLAELYPKSVNPA